MTFAAWLPAPDHDIGGRLAAEGFRLVVAPPASLFVNSAGSTEAAIANARNFADAVGAAEEALVIHILRSGFRQGWDDVRENASLWAFTRQAALAWAPRRIRINAIAVGVCPGLPDHSGEPGPSMQVPLADIVTTILAMWRFRCMTGQLVTLGGA